MDTQELTGFLLINKPVDISSFDCIRHLQKITRQAGLKKLKIGHAGTLDVFASGLMIIALGRKATKGLNYLSKLSKEYIATAQLGELTDTLDNTGEIVETTDASSVKGEDLVTALKSFGSEYEQIPPIYSALKHEGKPLYKLARHKKLDDQTLNKLVKQKSRTVQLHKLELNEFNSPFFTITAEVSKGTYIRTLMDDIGLKVGHHATTHKLKRTKIGTFSLSAAHDLASVITLEDIENKLIPVEQLTGIDF